MQHRMKLWDVPFKSIKQGTKTIEMRLYDEKRKQIKVNDIIEFTNAETGEVIYAQVLALHLYPTFDELYKNFPKENLGYQPHAIAHPNDMTKFYEQEEINQFGVVGIEIKTMQINNNFNMTK